MSPCLIDVQKIIINELYATPDFCFNLQIYQIHRTNLSLAATYPQKNNLLYKFINIIIKQSCFIHLNKNPLKTIPF